MQFRDALKKLIDGGEAGAFTITTRNGREFTWPSKDAEWRSDQDDFLHIVPKRRDAALEVLLRYDAIDTVVIKKRPPGM